MKIMRTYGSLVGFSETSLTPFMALEVVYTFWKVRVVNWSVKRRNWNSMPAELFRYNSKWFSYLFSDFPPCHQLTSDWLTPLKCFFPVCLPSKWKLWESNVFTSVCVCSWVGVYLVSCPFQRVGMPGLRTLMGYTWKVYPLKVHPLEGTSTLWCWYLEVVTETGGIHSTAMLTCFISLRENVHLQATKWLPNNNFCYKIDI